MEQNEMPIGFAMALAQNPYAMQKFASLSEDEKRMVIDGTHSIQSRNEMHRYVNDLVAGRKNDTMTQ